MRTNYTFWNKKEKQKKPLLGHPVKETLVATEVFILI